MVVGESIYHTDLSIFGSTLYTMKTRQLEIGNNQRLRTHIKRLSNLVVNLEENIRIIKQKRDKKLDFNIDIKCTGAIPTFFCRRFGYDKKRTTFQSANDTIRYFNHYMDFNNGRTFKFYDVSSDNVMLGAAMGLLFIQDTYNLSINDLYDINHPIRYSLYNNFNYNHMEKAFSPFDMMLLSVSAISLKWYEQAIDLACSAEKEYQLKGRTTTQPYNYTFHDVSSSLKQYAKHQILHLQERGQMPNSKRFLFFKQTTDKNLQTMINMKPVEEARKQEAIEKVLLQDEKIKSICRNDNASSAIEIARRHCAQCKCFQKNCDDKYLSLGPILYEIKSVSPIRILAHDFLSEHEIHILESNLKPRLTFERAMPLLTQTTAAYSSQLAKSPTIYITELFYEDSKELLKNISNRLERVTTLNVASPTKASRYRASWYGLGGWTGVHSDVYGISQGKEVHKRFRNMKSTGDIIMSVLIWVNNVKYGGATFFSSPEKYDVVAPSRGSAFFWVSTKSSGEKDEHQDHGGCPICKGSKFVIGKWIHNFDNWRAIPCGLHQDSDVNLNIVPSHN